VRLLKIDVIKGLAALGIGPMHSDLKGLDLILSYIDEAPFSVFSVLVGVILFGFMSWLAQRQPTQSSRQVSKIRAF